MIYYVKNIKLHNFNLLINCIFLNLKIKPYKFNVHELEYKNNNINNIENIKYYYF